jgi:hypothetical protein
MELRNAAKEAQEKLRERYPSSVQSSAQKGQRSSTPGKPSTQAGRRSSTSSKVDEEVEPEASLSRLIRQQFHGIPIPAEVMENIMLEYGNLARLSISIEQGIKSADLDWSQPNNRQRVFTRLELKYRHEDYGETPEEEGKNWFEKKKQKAPRVIWTFLKSLVVSDPFDEKEKPYIGHELERIIIDHNKINRTANLVSACIGIEAGKVFGGKLIQLLGIPVGFLQVPIALAINSGIFWALTIVTESRIRTNYYTVGERRWRWRPFSSLIVITFIKSLCVFYATLGGALDFTPADKRFLTDKYINNYIQELKAQVDEQQASLTLVDELFDPKTVDTRKDEIKKELNKDKNPIIQMYRKQSHWCEKAERDRKDLKLARENKESTQAQRDAPLGSGGTAIREIDSLRRAMIARGVEFEQGESQNQDPDLSLSKGDEFEIPPCNLSRPVFKEEQYYRTAVEYLRNPQKSSDQFIEEYFKARYGTAYTQEVQDLLKKDIEDLPIGDKVHILEAKLKNEFANGLFPSLFASSFVPLFLEAMSLLTLFSVFNAPRYKMLYSNRDFQDKIESIHCALIHYMQQKYEQTVKKRHSDVRPEVLEIEIPLVYEAFWEHIIAQRIREGKSPSIESLVAEYTQQFYKADPLKQKSNTHGQNRKD